MGGRGRGRGRGGGLSINIEAFGLGRGDILTPIVAQPPPLYPPQLFKPVPLSSSSELDRLDYMLALKQELRDNFKVSPFYVSAPTKVKDIARYSDKYQSGVSGSDAKWTPDWSRLPYELQEKRKRKKGVTGKQKVKSTAQNKDIDALLQKLEKDVPDVDAPEETDAPEEDDNKEKKNKDEQADDDEDEEEFDDEDMEEETDYNQAYFDNGEDYGDEDDDDDEGPTY